MSPRRAVEIDEKRILTMLEDDASVAQAGMNRGRSYVFIKSSILPCSARPVWDEILVTLLAIVRIYILGSTIKRALLMVQVFGFIRLDCFSD